ncbi:U11/U12 small nuclear ribonucleoprotein 35 kDa protein isoform 1-T2 [Anomaloglossus baeobatrachus]|uniref:U11/U12 small nuclear ribonucleoprotein 35 kDa protein n=1 Tax=Anomaloglossus baeobatrachus TaxID=238106 RepID=UPI003F4F69DE
MSEWTPIAKDYDPLTAGSIDGTDEEPHDRAVLRAMLARYVPNKGVVGDPQLTLFVARLSQQTTEQKLKEVFSRYGDVQRIRLIRDFITGFSKCYAFIEYKQEQAIKKAYRDANRLVIDQREVFVDFELERSLKGWVPRRLGGGFGGKKESGQLRFGGRDRPFRKPINLPIFTSNAYRENRQRERRYGWRERRTEYRWSERYDREHATERYAKEERNRDRERDDRRRESKRERNREQDSRK